MGRLAPMVVLVATVALAAPAGVVVRVHSRHWPEGTPAFSQPAGVAACRAEMREQGPAGPSCNKGARFQIGNGLRVVVTAVDGDTATVTVMDGAYAGQVGVVASEELERERPARPRPDATRPAALNAASPANGQAARTSAAAAARARCLDSCLLERCPERLQPCEDGCRERYQHAVTNPPR